MSLLRPSDDDVIVFLILLLSCRLVLPAEETSSSPSHEHGGVKMGVSNATCDNGEWKLDVDWDYTKDFEYKCQPDELPIPPLEKTAANLSCLNRHDIPPAVHKCMTASIQYKDIPPRGGPHRPLWPVYGEYLYAPPQRWVHSLEHGAVVFLHHPCADGYERERMKEIARGCLFRHVITPSRMLSRDQPFALLTYGCKLTMSSIEEDQVIEFIKENAFNRWRASEHDVSANGQYSFHLIRAAEQVPGSDYEDSRLCPPIDRTTETTNGVSDDLYSYGREDE